MSKTIKSIDKYRFNTFMDDNSNETVEITGELQSHIEYDLNGNLILSITYDASAKIAEHITYAYNDQNKLIQELLYDENEVVEKRQFEYNENDMIDKEKIFYLDDTFDTIFYNYDAEKNLIEKKLINTDNETESYHRFQFHDKKLLKESDYDADENLIYEKSFLYDVNGNIEKSVIYDAIEDDHKETVYEYDEHSNRTKILKYDKSGKLTERSTYKYDESNQLIALIEDNTLLSTTYLFEYDENAKLKIQKEINENEDVIATHTFTYNNDLLIETISEGDGYSNNYIIKNEIEFYN